MLIYNYKKDFLGIDEFDLQALGFKDLAHLQTEVSDISDLFVKTPGYIHNFKHVHWIDFITCADSAEPPKAVIHAHGANYRCNLKITTAYLSDNPAAPAFIVHLQNLRKLTDSENAAIASDVAYKKSIATPYAPPAEPFSHFETPQAAPVVHEFKETKPIIEEIPVQSNIVEDEYDNAPLEIDMEEDYAPTLEPAYEIPKPVPAAPVLKVETPKPKVASKVVEETIESGHEHEYIFDPHVASKELGLPVDLIEEFIQDFIAQAKEFKDELYKSLQELDITNVKILSHKLKGVAANLRVADALEVLTVVNTATDFAVIHANLDKFYKIISKLSGEEPAVVTNTVHARSEEDEFVVEFKDDDIDDSDVPSMIEMPELADDDFLPSEIEVPSDKLDIDFDTVDADELSLEVSDIDELPDMLDTFIDENEDTLELLHMAEETEIKPVVLLQTEEKPRVTISYKREVIANEIGIDIDSFNELFTDFIDEGLVKCEQIRNAIHDNNSDLWKTKAMKLKGMSENMRIKELSQELDAIIKTSSSDVALDSIDKIDAMMSLISQQGE